MIFAQVSHCSIGLLHLQLFASNLKPERPRLLIIGFDQLPCLVSILASLLKWVDFLINRVLIFPEREHAFPHLRKSITYQVPATITSKVAYVFLFWPLQS